ncbi:hypothetical protein F5882DRAFT_438320 [Hyaloscypha sp. PMI_1271]|nr:hypothetical protein F5882DRAFT_438320 [Hyaloscypha sp. PMI_1271]
MLSTSDWVALSFGLTATVLGIVTIVVTRRNQAARNNGQRAQYNHSACARHPQDVVVEEIHLRRWRSTVGNRLENGHAQLPITNSFNPHCKTQLSRTGVTALGGSAKVWGKDVSLAASERLAVEVVLGQEVGCGRSMWGLERWLN